MRYDAKVVVGGVLPNPTSEASDFHFGCILSESGFGNGSSGSLTSSAGVHDEGIAEMDGQLSAAKFPEGC
jgi:hypothetical protein